MALSKKIDVHAHFLPEEYTTALHRFGHGFPDGHIAPAPDWSEEAHLDLMKTVNTSKSILSISSPGTNLAPNDGEATRKLTRYCNEFAASIKKRRPEEFGFWASLPLPDVEGSLEEISWAGDVLNADGYALLTNVHGTYLGAPAFNRIFDELNRRRAVVFLHPTSPCLASGDIAVPMSQEIPRSVFEFFFDTSRAVMNLFLSGTISRWPHITFVIPHLGGAFPPLINRFAAAVGLLGLPDMEPKLSPSWVKERINAQFYFDTAGFSLPDQIRGLLPYVSVDRLLYGSDFPFTPAKAVIMLSDMHDIHLEDLFPDEADRTKVLTENAERLLGKTFANSVPGAPLSELGMKQCPSSQ
ncbi:aminocarboxymuconate-semialdehyde decarboxylase [Dactylonectria macrodidyma]|uniref:6-methylsalicylate decarboxylase n=1 Tax=Dactylonectria macrodidyma TaxID=307937 RepID=A0A9P9IIH9_9HYPO|nr:aminocarboxymuconate-semialdehyde decarboxylase [Dactylonectria macrodidyma]